MTQTPSQGRTIGIAIGWVSASQVGRQVLQVGVTTVLARILVPEDFGLMSLTLLVVGVFALFRDLGTGVTIIRVPNLTMRMTSTLFWANVGLGVLAATGVAVMAPVLGVLFRAPQLVDIVTVSALMFTISSLSIVHQAVLERRMRFRLVAAVELVAASFGAATAIAAAVVGLGVWSLVAQVLVTAMVGTGMYWLVGDWRPTFEFSWGDLRSVGRFGLGVTGFNVFNYAARNADYALVGATLGSGPLGQYSLAYRVMLYPMQAVSAMIARATYPVYARLQADDAQLRHLYLRVVSMIGLAAFPLVFGVMATSGRLVAVAFGPRWTAAGDVLAVLAPVGLVQVIATTVGSLYQAKGRAGLMLKWGILSGSVTMLAFAIGLNWGIVGVAGSYLVVTLLLAYPGLAIPYRLIGLSVGEVIAAIARPAICGAAMYVAVAAASRITDEPSGSPVALALLVAGGASLYILLSLVINRSAVRTLLQTLTEARSSA